MALPLKSNLDCESTAKIINLPDPSAAQDAATKAYVDAAVEGLAWKDAARVASQANINLASPGASIDGISLVAGDRVLVQAQSAPAENGLYIWNGAAVAMSRALDANAAAELEQAVVTVEEGTSAGATFRQTAINFTLGTDSVLWIVFGTAAGAATEITAGIAEIATQTETNTGTDDARFVTPLKLASWSGRLRKVSSTFGDGAATQYDITHNLNTSDVQISVYRISDGVEIVCDMRRSDVNTARLNFLVAPASNSLRCVVLG